MSSHRLSFAAVVLMAAGAAGAQSAPTIPGNLEEVAPVTVLEAPAPRPETLTGPGAAKIEHGRYLVELIGCGACHTDGAIVGEPDKSLLLAGSHVGIAYTSPVRDRHPGVVYPPNLTPHRETGLGNWTEEQIAAAIRTGQPQHGAGRLTVMSWPLYRRMSDEDVGAIVAYLRSIPPVKHAVPKNVEPGTKASGPYVHFSVYRTKGE